MGWYVSWHSFHLHSKSITTCMHTCMHIHHCLSPAFITPFMCMYDYTHMHACVCVCMYVPVLRIPSPHEGSREQVLSGPPIVCTVLSWETVNSCAVMLQTHPCSIMQKMLQPSPSCMLPSSHLWVCVHVCAYLCHSMHVCVNEYVFYHE